MQKWSLENICWDELEYEKVEPAHLVLARTASLVEYNSADYTDYLKAVFSNDPDFEPAIEQWGEEERQHGWALKTWVEKVDPSFDFEASLERFRESFRLPQNVQQSVRGSRSGELVARCMVESGTSSYYAALRDSSEEPIFRQICHWISTDEVRHFNLFYKWLERYLEKEEMGGLKRFRIALGRSLEVEDEELSFAYAAANLPGEEISKDRLKRYNQGLLSLIYGYYDFSSMRLGVRLALKAAGIQGKPWLVNLATRLSLGTMGWRKRKLRSLPQAPRELVEPIRQLAS